jgi:3-keto-disaccharide hydrolase
MMKPYLFVFIWVVFLISLSGCEKKTNESRKDISQSKNIWVPLFNGKNLNNWNVKLKGYPLNEDPYNTFRVKNGVLQISYDNYESFNATYGHLFYKDPYSSYKLRLQYRFIGEQVKGGEDWAKKNSGVMIHSQSPESMAVNQDFPVSIEVQLLGGLKEGENRPTANLCTPGTHVIMDGKLIETHCINSSSKTFYDEQWIDLEIIVFKDSIIKHKINGELVLTYSKPQIGGEYNTLVSKEGEILKSGYISLQSESHPIEFRKIELLKLDY